MLIEKSHSNSEVFYYEGHPCKAGEATQRQECLLCKQEDLSSNAQSLYTEPGVAACACDHSHGEDRQVFTASQFRKEGMTIWSGE